MIRKRKLHYKSAQKRDMGEIGRWFCDSLGRGVDVQCVVDGALWRFGAGGLAHVQGAAVGATEGGGDAVLAAEDPAQRGPTGVFPACARRRRMTWRVGRRWARRFPLANEGNNGEIKVGLVTVSHFI